jgi:hypothetical protein
MWNGKMAVNDFPASFRALFSILARGVEEYQEKLESGEPIFGPRIESVILR